MQERIPFYIFTYESRFEEYENDADKRKILGNEAAGIMEKPENPTLHGEIPEGFVFQLNVQTVFLIPVPPINCSLRIPVLMLFGQSSLNQLYQWALKHERSFPLLSSYEYLQKKH